MSGVPIYRLALVAHDVSCEIRVNDVPVLRLPGGRVETAFDVNPHVLDGPNTLELRVRAPAGKSSFGQLSSCSVELSTKASLTDADAVPVTSLRWRVPTGAASGFEDSAGFAIGTPPLVRQIGLAATQSFTLDVPFGPWFWQQAPTLAATEATRAEVLAAYRSIHAQLVARDIAALERACVNQARDWQAAYGLADLAAAQRMLGIAATLGDPDIMVEDFPEDVLTMELLGDARLVQLVDDQGKSPLRLRLRSHSSDAVLGRFNVVLCRADAGFVIAR